MNLYQRNILDKIFPFIKRKEAIIVRGMRRVGKTSLLYLIKEILIKENIKESQIYFFDLERLDIRDDFNDNPENLLKYLDKLQKKKFVFVDEIQYLDNPSNFIKILVDHHPDVKLFTTGSSSLEIKRKIQDSLIGRAVYFHLYPLTFLEFLEFKNKKFPTHPSPAQNRNLRKFLDEYLLFGGFPEVVMETRTDVKISLLENYINLYVNKDIRALAEIENLTAFNNLVKVLGGQIGQLLNKDEISNTLNIANRTTNRYLEILEFTYVIFLLKPFFNNLRSKLTKTPKIYFYDLGIRNSLANNFSKPDFRVDNGAMFENFIFLELASAFSLDEINFYRSTQQSEIDFVVDKKKMAIEVKYKNFKEKRIFRVFDNFSNFKNYVVNLNFNNNSKNYSFVDWWSFINKLNL